MLEIVMKVAATISCLGLWVLIGGAITSEAKSISQRARDIASAIAAAGALSIYASMGVMALLWVWL